MHTDIYMPKYIYGMLAYSHAYAMTNSLHFNGVVSRLLSNLISMNPLPSFRQQTGNVQVFDKIVGYDGIKRTFVRSLASKEPVPILLVGPPGQAVMLSKITVLQLEVRDFLSTMILESMIQMVTYVVLPIDSAANLLTLTKLC